MGQLSSAAVPLCLAGPGTTGHWCPVWPGGDTGRHLVHTLTIQFRNIYSDILSESCNDGFPLEWRKLLLLHGKL